MRDEPLDDADYAALTDLRYALRQFQAFSDAAARAHGLTPQQHQALLALRAVPPDQASIGYVARQLLLRPHSASGLIDRLEKQALVTRYIGGGDRRRALLRLTPRAMSLLVQLSHTHRDEIRRLRPMLNELLARFS